MLFSSGVPGVCPRPVDPAFSAGFRATERERSRYRSQRLLGYCAADGRAFGLQPHRGETFKLSTDPYFVDKVHDAVGLYLDPPERALVFCVDEKSQIQALDI